ncbi:MAG: ATP-binding cassette, subfamily uup, partial [Rhodospirillales bacterium]|nr:ATP-binding cassette, subfamily uup [Rhodospirillales bacterium]
MAASEAEGSGNLVALAENASKSFGDRTVIREANARIMRGDRIGIVGPNGADKTTLLKMLTGELEPDSGTIRRGTAIEMVTLDQKREALPPETTLSQALTEGRGDQVFINGQPRHVVGYMKDFLFLPEQARTAVSVLSGGERGRLMLARAFARPSNLLVLDEPTNDLDLETLDLLQELIAEYGGTVLVVSHDRDFLDRTVTGILAYEGDGRWQDYAGGYSDMIVQRGRGVEARAAAVAGNRPRGATANAGAAAARKMTFKDKHALEALPGRIDKLTAEIALLRQKLADGALFTRDYAAFKRFTNGLATREKELAEAEEEWMRLEAMREEVEA